MLRWYIQTICVVFSFGAFRFGNIIKNVRILLNIFFTGLIHGAMDIRSDWYRCLDLFLDQLLVID